MKFNELVRFTENRSRDLYLTNGVPTKSLVDAGIYVTPFALDIIVDYLESMPPSACQDEFIEEEVQIPLNKVLEVIQAAQYLLLPLIIDDIMDKIQASRVHTSIANATLGRDRQPMGGSFPTPRDIEHLVQMNALDYTFDGNTPLIVAVLRNNLDMVKVLLDKGADLSVATNEGFTPLMFAVQNNNLDMVKVLLDKGADLSAANNQGFTPLMFAVLRNNLDMVKVLLDKGADLSVATNEGFTPLMFAVQNNNLDMVNFLKAEGAKKAAAPPPRRPVRARQPPSRFLEGGAYFGIHFI